MIQSKALEVNLEQYRIDVKIEPRYLIIKDIMSKYYGLIDRLDTFLKELSHPYKNWGFIVQEARRFSLEYFYLIKEHPEGHRAAVLYIDIFSGAIESSAGPDVISDAVDNLLLFISKIAKESGNRIETFMPVLNTAFDRISQYDDRIFMLFVKSYYQLNKIAQDFPAAEAGGRGGHRNLNAILIKYFQHTHQYWLGEDDPLTWIKREAETRALGIEEDDIFGDISHQAIQQWEREVHRISREENIDSVETTRFLLQLPGYGSFVRTYRGIPQTLLDRSPDIIFGNQLKVLFLFFIMNTSGLSMIHEEALRDINRTLSWLIACGDYKKDKKLISKTFTILKDRVERFPDTVMNCVLNMGEGVYETDNTELINYFIDKVIDLGFQMPKIEGVGDDWQIQANSAHIRNIRTWLELIGQKPQWSSRLMSALTIYLSVCGVFIKDTDLFPRDITRFLNSNISPVYNIAKQLLRLFPSFFNDIGAEGKLRDVSTELDEICHRKDILVHVLRKQSHVESSNRIIGFIDAAVQFWKTRDKHCLEPFVPPDIFERIETSGPYVDGVHNIMSALRDKGVSLPDDFFYVSEERLGNLLRDIPEVSEEDRKRVALIATFYKLLDQKYNINFFELDNYISKLNAQAFPDLDRLKEALSETDLTGKVVKLLDYLEVLKSLILSPETFEIREDIYKKRHIAVDIPSMYGSYHEIKFDALGLTLRIESLLNVLFEELVANLDLSIITKGTLHGISRLMALFDKTLKLDGISSKELRLQLELLEHSIEIREFSFTQYLDIFNGLARAVNNIINDYFHNIHENNLTRILSRIPPDQILSKYLSPDGSGDVEKLKHRISEIFFRDKIAVSLGLQQLDLLLSRVLNTLFSQSEKLPEDKLHQLLNYDPKKAMTRIDTVASKGHGIIHLGNKGLNLIKLQSYGWPVPPGFIITTEVFRSREIIDTYMPAERNLRRQLGNHLSILEKHTGKSFGKPGNPLLLSVRSGSSISQPGMMDSFLDVGMNDTIASGLAETTGNPWFAWDNYRRYLQGYGMSFGLKRDDFDAIINDFKRVFGVPFKKEFTGEQMRQVALSYKNMIQDAGVDMIDSPFEQLFYAIKSVIRSWESDRARTYRKIIGISDDWGTAVTVQTMVFGNISATSGAGVFFTHSPKLSGDTLTLWGDFTVSNQGEDVVSGLVKTLAISEIQKDMEQRESDVSLESDFPDIYSALKNLAHELIYRRGWNPQEVEFTFESPSRNDLYLLQTRDMSIRERKTVLAFDLEELMSTKGYLGHGIGVSGGAMSGRIVFSLEGIEKWRRAEPGMPLILIRNDTVPDDIREIFAADGLLTAKGGVTSHAAVVAHRLEKTCVVGCGSFICNETERTCLFNDTLLLKSGDFISIDGQEGSVYQGFLKIKEM